VGSWSRRAHIDRKMRERALGPGRKVTGKHLRRE
jgi:hypothetical protein